MSETLILGAICISLLASAAWGVSVVYALAAGLVLLCGYAYYRERSAKNVFTMASQGFKTSSSVLIMLMLIGILGATWRACGTIPYVIYHALNFCDPSFVLVTSFLVCCAMSAIMGTAIGTATTVGIICMALCMDMGINPAFAGGAILAGSYFGDRWSPVSASSCVVAAATNTDRYANLSKMIRPALVPLAITVVLFLVLGSSPVNAFNVDSTQQALHRGFAFSPWLVVPMVAVLVLSLFRVDFKISMAASITCAAALMVGLQGFPIQQIPELVVFGFHPDGGFSARVEGGGLFPLLTIMGVIAISSCYSGILSATGMIDPLCKALQSLARKTTRFTAITVASVATNAVACNQTLAVLLSAQMFKDDGEGNQELALALEDTAVPIAALIPWSTACMLPLSALGAPVASVAFASFLYLLPLCGIAKSFRSRRMAQRR